MEKKSFLQGLKQIEKLISGLNDEDFAAFIQGDTRFILARKDEILKSAGKKRRATTPSGGEDIDFTQVIEALNLIPTETEAIAYLTNCQQTKTKDMLIALGRRLNANISTKQTKADIIQVIVKHTVGRRLQSQAITQVTGETEQR